MKRQIDVWLHKVFLLFTVVNILLNILHLIVFITIMGCLMFVNCYSLILVHYSKTYHYCIK